MNHKNKNKEKQNLTSYTTFIPDKSLLTDDNQKHRVLKLYKVIT